MARDEDDMMAAVSRTINEANGPEAAAPEAAQQAAAPVAPPASVADTPAALISERFAAMTAGAQERRTGFDLERRRLALKTLAKTVRSHEREIIAALAADLGKPEPEVRLTEILPVQAEISHTLKHLKGWMKVRKVKGTLATMGTKGLIRPEPKGTVLIIAPWNYPLGLALGPLVSALGAGNAAIIKPSEFTPATSALPAKMMETAFSPDLVWVAEGGAGVAQTLLDKPFDHVFFTGSPAVGRKVMAQAAQHLTQVTLELGGKSPVIVGPDADIPAAARAIVWGKFANAGQTCIAPDHVYVAAQRMDKFLKAVRAEIARMYGKDPEGQMASGDLSRIVSARHYQRLVDMINQAESMGATIALGGAGDAESRFVAPTVLTGVRPDMTVMREEIFGPILPLIPFEDIDAVIARINKGPKPLALYVFGKDKGFIDRVSTATSSGAVGVNVTLAHYMHLNLPFGGIGNSGIGAAHGEWGFRAFSHEKPVLVNRRAPLASFMPPYKGLKRRKIRMMARLLGR